MAQVTFNFWAGARAAAGTAAESVEAGSVAAALEQVLARHDAHLARVVGASSLLVDGVAASGDALRRPLAGATVVEVLPPFAGG